MFGNIIANNTNMNDDYCGHSTCYLSAAKELPKNFFSCLPIFKLSPHPSSYRGTYSDRREREQNRKQRIIQREM